MQSAKPQWDEFFAFELVAPAFAVLKVKVMDHMHCWKPQLLGEVSSIPKTCVSVCRTTFISDTCLKLFFPLVLKIPRILELESENISVHLGSDLCQPNQ